MPHLIPTFALGSFLCLLPHHPHLLRLCWASTCPIQANGGRWSYQLHFTGRETKANSSLYSGSGWSLSQLGFGFRSHRFSSGFPQKHRPTDVHFHLAHHGAMAGPPSSICSVGPAATLAHAERPQNRPASLMVEASEKPKGFT